MTLPFFTIIIPTYNRADFVLKTIHSLLKQTFQDFEIIVVDDGSTDNTEEVVTAIKDERLFYFKKENAERGAARNFGAQKAKGQYLNFFDSDDIAYPNHLQVAYELIQDKNSPNVFVLSCDHKDLTGKNLNRVYVFKDINQQLISGNLLSCDAVFLKKEIAEKHTFSEIRALSGSEDYLLWLQIAARFRFYFKTISTSSTIVHEGRSVLSLNSEQLIERKELMLKMALADEQIVAYYGKHIKYLKANTYSYLALHLALGKNKKQSRQYLKKAIAEDKSFVLKRRHFAILKHLWLS